MSFRTATHSDEGYRFPRVFVGFMECLHGRWAMIMSFACYCAWTWIVFFGYASNVSLTTQTMPPLWAVPTGGVAVTFLVLAVLRKTWGIVPHGRAYRVFWCMSVAFGNTMSLLQSMGLAVWPVSIELVSLAAIGMGSACMHLEYQRVFGSWGAKATLVAGTSAVFLGTCLMFVLELLPVVACHMYIMVFPFVALAVFHPYGSCKLWKIDQKTNNLHVPWRLIVTMLLQGLSFGVMQTIILYTETEGNSPLLSVIAFGVAAVAMSVTAVFYKMDFNQLFYQVGLPLMALGYVAMPLYEPLGILLHSIGYRFTAILCWVLCAYLVHQKGASVTWVFSWAIASLMVGELMGALAATALKSVLRISLQTASVASLVTVFALLMSSLLLSDRRNLSTGWGLLRPTEEEWKPDSVELGCNLLGHECGLTAREIEVLVLLARGHTKAEVAEKFSLSRDTIKAHARSIYTKLGVHTQRELVVLVETRTEGFSNEDGQPLALTAF